MGDQVVLLAKINSISNNARIYGYVVDTTITNSLTIQIERTVMV